MEKRIEKKTLGDLTVTYTVEMYTGDAMDTLVEINGQRLCSISGPEREQFHNALEDIVQRHRI